MVLELTKGCFIMAINPCILSDTEQLVCQIDSVLTLVFFEGSKHGTSILHESGLQQDLLQGSFDTDGNILWIYEDPTYPVRSQLQKSFGLVELT